MEADGGDRAADAGDGLQSVDRQLESLGVWSAALSACIAAVAYVGYGLVTPDLPHRWVIFAGAAFVAGTSAAVSANRDRLLSRMSVLTLTTAWSIPTTLTVFAGIVADGSASSPVALILVAELTLISLYFPTPLVVGQAVGASVLFSIAAIALGVDPLPGVSDVVYVLAVVGTYLFIAAFTVVQRRQNHRERRILAEASRTDPLTGILNRRGFEERPQSSIDQADRLGRPVALLTLDLDAFKVVNDTQGHAAGDRVLRDVATGLERTTRGMDSVARLGGDEFGILLPGAGDIEAARLGEVIADSLRPVIGVSVGVAVYPTDGLDTDELFRSADVEMYSNKQRTPGTRSELSWAVTLAEAVDNRTGGSHSREVTAIAAAIAERRGWSEDAVAELRIAATLHDIGLSAVPDSTLTTQQPLTPAQRTDIDRHATIGADMLARVDGTEVIVPWIRHSHEHFDGSGVPDRLRHDDIPEASRILHVADAFSAMTSGRPYRSAVSIDAALEELLRLRGIQFDPEIVGSLVAHLRARERTERP